MVVLFLQLVKCFLKLFRLNALWVIYKNSLDYQVTLTREILRWHVERLLYTGRCAQF